MKGVTDNKSLHNEIKTLKEEKYELAENMERFRLLYENLPLGYQSLDLQGDIIIINTAWLDLLGYASKEEVIGRNFGDFVTDADLFIERFPKFKACGITKEVIFEMVKKDGSIILVSIDGRVSYDKDGNFIQTHCVLHNVTERKQAEEKLNTRTEELEKLNKAFVGRELKMIELKEEIKELKKRDKT